jgi:nitrate reductase beta subunit
MPTVCSETCVGRIRYLGVVLYDADRIEQAASVTDEKDLLDAQLDVFLDPHDPKVLAQAKRDGIPEDWLEAAQRSPVWKLAMDWKIALPLHPEYRTLPMVWYIPPLSPVMSLVEGKGSQADPDDVFPAIDELRIPVQYLANILTAGDEGVIRDVLKRLAAMRAHMRAELIGSGEPDPKIAESVGMTRHEIEDMYRLCAIAKYNDRYVIPLAHREIADNLEARQGGCGLDFAGGPGSCGPGFDNESALGESDFDLVAAAEGKSARLPITRVPGERRIRS